MTTSQPLTVVTTDTQSIRTKHDNICRTMVMSERRNLTNSVGELVLKELSAEVARCAYCERPLLAGIATQVVSCVGCKLVKYCHPTHRQLHWNTHIPRCQLSSELRLEMIRSASVAVKRKYPSGSETATTTESVCSSPPMFTSTVKQLTPKSSNEEQRCEARSGVKNKRRFVSGGDNEGLPLLLPRMSLPLECADDTSSHSASGSIANGESSSPVIIKPAVTPKGPAPLRYGARFAGRPHPLQQRQRSNLPSPFPGNCFITPSSVLPIKRMRLDDTSSSSVTSQEAMRQAMTSTQSTMLIRHIQNMCAPEKMAPVLLSPDPSPTPSTEHFESSVAATGWSKIENFMNAFDAELALTEVECLFEKGLFTDGHQTDPRPPHLFRHGGGQAPRYDCVLRYDEFNPKCSKPVLNQLIRQIDSLVARLNIRNCRRSKLLINYLPAANTEFPLHVDTDGSDGRQLTVIYYINPGWRSSYGGRLQLQLRDGRVVDLDPHFNRLVAFQSCLKHRVTPTIRQRFALQLWYHGS